MAGLTPIYFTAAPKVYVCINVDRTKYDGEIARIVGASTSEPPSGSVVFFLSEKEARRSGALIRLKLGIKLGSKRRQVPLICDKDKAVSALASLGSKKIKIGYGAGVDWDITTVKGG